MTENWLLYFLCLLWNRLKVCSAFWTCKIDLWCVACLWKTNSCAFSRLDVLPRLDKTLYYLFSWWEMICFIFTAFINCWIMLCRCFLRYCFYKLLWTFSNSLPCLVERLLFVFCTTEILWSRHNKTRFRSKLDVF
jgi:hypothetical protein